VGWTFAMNVILILKWWATLTLSSGLIPDLVWKHSPLVTRKGRSWAQTSHSMTYRKWNLGWRISVRMWELSRHSVSWWGAITCYHLFNNLLLTVIIPKFAMWSICHPSTAKHLIYYGRRGTQWFSLLMGASSFYGIHHHLNIPIGSNSAWSLSGRTHQNRQDPNCNPSLTRWTAQEVYYSKSRYWMGFMCNARLLKSQ